MSTVKCLPAIVKRAKDATRAAGEANGKPDNPSCERMDIWHHLLDLPHFRVWGYALEKDPDQDILHLHCELQIGVAVCFPCVRE